MNIVKNILKLIILCILVGAVAFVFTNNSIKPIMIDSSKTKQFAVNHWNEEPIIHSNSHQRLQSTIQDHGYNNINRPSLIKVPEWVQNPLGNYYLYFAHHQGTYIRMAYADSLNGQWTVYDGKILPLKQPGFVQEAGSISGLKTQQQYNSVSENIALIKIAEATNHYYGLAMPGFLYRSKDGLSNFEVRKSWLLDSKVRHAGLFLINQIYLYFIHNHI